MFFESHFVVQLSIERKRTILTTDFSLGIGEFPFLTWCNATEHRRTTSTNNFVLSFSEAFFFGEMTHARKKAALHLYFKYVTLF
jgi:hypothetical protein